MEADKRTGNRQQATRNRQLKRGEDIAERLLRFAVAVLRLTASLPKRPAERHVASQLVRSSTSAGANYEEARAAESRDDFVHKVGVAAKEMRESIYWLQLIRRAGWSTSDLDRAVGEASELAAILVASSRTARSRA